jgi:DNA-binding IclR family transcriptional regulator
MTENQKAVLSILANRDMSMEDLAVELHSCNKRMKNTLIHMKRNKWIEYDKDDDVYRILIEYAPPVEWSFKELLGAWK